MKKKYLYIILVTFAVNSSVLNASDYSFYSNETQEEHNSQWTYEGEFGPANWGNMGDSFLDCKLGKRQSPINFEQNSTSYVASNSAIYFDYRDVDLNMINNGHTIQVNISKGSEAIFNGKKYRLTQIHFHSPSEHTINGNSVPMEAHLVHKADDGELAVLAVMFEEGKQNSFLLKLWKNMPVHVNESNISQKVKINAIEILPNSKDYYHYLGSLTTPPCTQIVEWYVLKDSVTISDKQLERFHRLYNANARPVQKLHDRVILEKK